MVTVDWWPSASPAGWSWTPAVHVVALLLAVAPLVAVVAAARTRRVPLRHRSRVLLGSGTALLLFALSWPLADIGQVTLSGRTLQYLLLTLIAPPLVLLGIPRWQERGRGAVRRVLERFASLPWIGAVLLAATTWLTHTGLVIDGFETTAAGAAAVRAAWLAAAFLYWWPLLGPGPERERLSYFAGVGYLVLPFIFPKVPAVGWIFATDVLHDRYLIGPGTEVWGITPLADQGVAAFILWLPGSIVIAAAVYLLFRHWWIEDRRLVARQRLGLPADPLAIAAIMSGPDANQRWSALEELVRIIADASPPSLGTDLAFEVRGERVILQLQVPTGAEEQRTMLVERIEAGYTVHLRQYPDDQAASIRQRLLVEVLPYGSRVR